MSDKFLVAILTPIVYVHVLLFDRRVWRARLGLWKEYILFFVWKLRRTAMTKTKRMMAGLWCAGVTAYLLLGVKAVEAWAADAECWDCSASFWDWLLCVNRWIVSASLSSSCLPR